MRQTVHKKGHQAGARLVKNVEAVLLQSLPPTAEAGLHCAGQVGRTAVLEKNGACVSHLIGDRWAKTNAELFENEHDIADSQSR